jgi:hypothetical protein
VAFLNLGYTSESAATTSIEAIKRAQDLAVFWGEDTAAVIDAIQMGVLGMTRGLRQYNVVIDDNKIKAKAQTLGLWDGVEAMNAQTKAAATLQIILDQTSYAQGAAAASTNTWTGQVRGITVAWTEFTRVMGQGFITALMGIMPVVTKILNWLIGIATTFSQLMGLLFGITVQTNAATAGLQGAASAAGDLAGNTAAAGKAAKGALAAFDQLNVLQQDQGTAGVPVLGTIDVAMPAMPEYKKITEGWIAEFGKLWVDFWKDPWGNIVRAAQVAWMWIVQTAKNAADAIAKWINKAVVDIRKWFRDASDNIAKWLNQAWIDIQKAWADAGAWFNTNVIIPIVAWFKQAADNIAKWINQAWIDIQAWWKGAGAWFYDNVTKPVSDWFSQAWANIKQWAIDTWNNIVKAWNGAGDWFKLNVTDPISLWFSTAWTDITNFVSTAWDNIVLAWTNASVWFQTTVIDPIKAAFKTVTDWLGATWNSTFTGIKDFVKGTVNTIIGFINSMISAVVGGINAAISALNSLSITIPDWVPLIGGNQWGIHINPVSAPQIPYLATGAVIPPNAAFLAVVGDQRSGTNIEAPEALIRRIVREETQGMNGGNITVTFGGTMGELIRLMNPQIIKENNRIGKSLIVGVIS